MNKRLLFLPGSGLDLKGFGGDDWKSDYKREYPDAKISIVDERLDFTNDLSEITHPVLILCLKRQKYRAFHSWVKP